jgi:hypothetical protein
VSPILTRPVREQLEHDRVIRQLQPRYKRKHEAIINPGAEQNQSVKVGDLAVYPDLVLLSAGGRKLEGTVEVETGESVNQLEALAEWGVFSKLRVPLHLYIPPPSLDTARRLCEEHSIPVAEIWTYHLAVDQVRFTLVHRAPAPAKAPAMKPANARPAARATASKGAAKAGSKPAGKAGGSKKTASRSARTARRPARRPAKKSKPAKKRR